jgi:hypothetical protein
VIDCCFLRKLGYCGGRVSDCKCVDGYQFKLVEKPLLREVPQFVPLPTAVRKRQALRKVVQELLVDRVLERVTDTTSPGFYNHLSLSQTSWHSQVGPQSGGGGQVAELSTTFPTQRQAGRQAVAVLVRTNVVHRETGVTGFASHTPVAGSPAGSMAAECATTVSVDNSDP